jgi:hypothetical protein
MALLLCIYFFPTDLAMTHHDLIVTIIPHVKGPSAGPTNIPDENHLVLVARSVGPYMSRMCRLPQPPSLISTSGESDVPGVDDRLIFSHML